MTSVLDCGVAKQCDNYLVTEPRFSVQPYLLPNTLDCLRRAIGLAGAYRLTGAGCKKDFNKGVLPVAHIWSHIKEGDRVKHQDLEVISQFGEGEEFSIASKSSLELRIRGPWLKPWPRTTPLPASSTY